MHQVCGFNQKTTKGWRVLKAYTEEEDVVGWEIIVPYWNSAKPSQATDRQSTLSDTLNRTDGVLGSCLLTRLKSVEE